MLLFALFALSQTARAQEFVYSVSHVQQFGDPSDPSSVMTGYYTLDEQQASQPNQPGVNTCDPCKRDALKREIACGAIAGTCEYAAYVAYKSKINDCKFQPYCDPTNPAFNQAQCDSCRTGARNTFLAATAACGSAATGCYLTLPSCFDKHTCPNGPNGPPGPCN